MPTSPKKLAVGLLFDDTLDSNDGVAQQVKRLGEWLNSHGHHVVYLCGETKLKDWAGGKVYSLSKNVRVKFNGNRLSIPLRTRASKIKRVLEQETLDVIHVQAPYSPLMAQKVIKKVYRDTAIVATVHIVPASWLARLGSRLLRLIQLRSLSKINQTISVSTAAAAFASKYLGLDSVVIPNMISLETFSKATAKDQASRIVFLGRLVPRKGCKQLIQAFSVLAETHPEAELIIAGDGAQRKELESLVNSLGLVNKVKFLGFIDEADKPSLLASARIACFPALGGESFGIVLIEAMAAGSGVVLAGDNAGYRSVMAEQEQLLVDPKNKQIFADRLAQLLDDKSTTNDLHNWQASHVKQYDTNIVAEQILQIYQAAFAKKSKAGDN